MNANTAVIRTGAGQAGAMVRSGTSLYLYWQGAATVGAVTVVLSDLSGRPPHELLDGDGLRVVEVPAGQTGLYLNDLLPGHLYGVEILTELGSPLFRLGPVQTPWLPNSDPSAFPAPYHRS